MFKILDLKEGTFLKRYLNNGNCVGDVECDDYQDAKNTFSHLLSISKYNFLHCIPDKNRQLHEFEIVEI